MTKLCSFLAFPRPQKSPLEPQKVQNDPKLSQIQKSELKES